MAKEKRLARVRELALITLASAAYAGAWLALVLPYGIISGGMTGLCNLLYYVTGVSVAVAYPVVNALLFLAAFKFLGWKFFARTLYSICAISAFAWLGEKLLTDPATGQLVKILGDERFMAMLLGCSITGLSLATLFACSGSSGGSDIIAAVANKYFDVQIGTALATIDFLVIGSGLFFPQLGEPLERVRFVAFGLCAMGVENMTIDYVLNRLQRSVQFLIFSKKHEELAKAIAEATQHSMTLLDGHGFYTGSDVKVICMLARMNESVEILRIIKRIDPTAFVSQSRAIGVWGEGFSRIKLKTGK